MTSKTEETCCALVFSSVHDELLTLGGIIIGATGGKNGIDVIIGIWGGKDIVISNIFR